MCVIEKKILDVKLLYGLKENELISIDEVESGLSCDCICPACKKQLIAKKGKVNVHHFAHYQTADCNGGLETALHLLSKDIIANQNTFSTPELYYPGTKYMIYPKMDIPIDNVRLEKKLGGIIPDIIIESKGKILIIEIVVNNDISWEKLRKIETQNIPTIAIYAKYLFRHLYFKKDFGLKNNEFLNEIVNGTDFKRWIHNPKIKKIKTNLKSNYSEEKIVKSFKTEEMGYYNFVEDCPLEKKFWKSGKNKGKPYASIDYDCNDCDFCIDIDYDQIPHRRLEFYSYSVPKKVYCLGYLQNDFRALIKQLN